MFEFMKIVHMFALLGGGAVMIGNGILISKLLKNEGPPPPMVPATTKILAKIGLVSIILLWITGTVMTPQIGVGMSLGFGLKLIGATMVLGASLVMAAISARAAKAGVPPNLRLLQRISRLAHVGVTLAIIFAVTVFN